MTNPRDSAKLRDYADELDAQAAEGELGAKSDDTCADSAANEK